MMIELMRGGIELLPRTRRMWEKLNAGNIELSPDFSDHFRGRSFEERMGPVIGRANGGHGIVIVVSVGGKDIGYMVGTIGKDGVAELDSLYIEEEHRDEGIGGILVDEFLEWTKAFPTRRTIVSVTWGNDSSPRLYERHGFRRRATIYEIPP